MKNTKKRGFTIVELVIVIAVIAILASVLIPTFTNVVQAANKSKALQEARNAYTDYLAEYVVKNNGELPKDVTCIKSGNFHFAIENGQLKTDECSNKTEHDCYEVESGKIKVGTDGNATLAEHTAK